MSRTVGGKVRTEGINIVRRIGGQTEETIRLINAVWSDVRARDHTPTAAVEMFDQGEGRSLRRRRNRRGESDRPNIVGAKGKYTVELIGTVADTGSNGLGPLGTVVVHGQSLTVVILRPVEADRPGVVGGVGGRAEQEREQLPAVAQQAADGPDVIRGSRGHGKNAGLVARGELRTGERAPLGAVPLFDDLSPNARRGFNVSCSPRERGRNRDHSVQ